MSAEQALLDAYKEWYRLAKAGTSAIRAGNWKLLRECQSRVHQFQPVVTRLTDEAREEWKQSGADFTTKEKQLGTLVSGLVELTRENLRLIRQRRETTLVKLDECAAAGRNLKQLTASAQIQHPGWTLFS